MRKFVLLCFLFSTTAQAETAPTRFQGFSRGQSGAGAIVGAPFSARYQRWMDFRNATFFSFGYSLDKYLVADANYAYYFLSEDDRWKMNNKVGQIFYSAFAGVTGGTYIGTAKNEKARLGARIGGAFEYLLPDTTWVLRLEVAPVLYLSGTTTAGLQGGIGVMYYFDQGKKKKSRRKIKVEESSSSGEELDL